MIIIIDDESAPRQRSWDAPGIARDWATIWNNCVIDIDRARLVALKAIHSSDWLFALTISSCGLRMCDETIRVAVGSRLGLNLCEAHILSVWSNSERQRHTRHVV